MAAGMVFMWICKQRGRLSCLPLPNQVKRNNSCPVPGGLLEGQARLRQGDPLSFQDFVHCAALSPSSHHTDTRRTKHQTSGGDYSLPAGCRCPAPEPQGGCWVSIRGVLAEAARVSVATPRSTLPQASKPRLYSVQLIQVKICRCLLRSWFSSSTSQDSL